MSSNFQLYVIGGTILPSPEHHMENTLKNTAQGKSEKTMEQYQGKNMSSTVSVVF